MLEYVQLFPETIAAVRRYPAADRALLYEAMVVYGTEGTGPDWPEDDLKWLIWESLKQRVDSAARKSDTNRRNRSGRNGTNENETQRDGTKRNETERTTTNRDPDTEAEAETDTDPESETPEIEPHTGKRQQGNAGAGACEARVIPGGWYDPDHPEAPADKAWMTSGQARQAIAQRIIDYVMDKDILDPTTITTDEGIPIGRECFTALCAAMEGGVPPSRCQAMADGAVSLWGWELLLKEAAIRAGTAPPEWRGEVEELSDDLEDLIRYG